MASKQLIKTFLDRRINFHLIRVAKIQRERNPKKINISYVNRKMKSFTCFTNLIWMNFCLSIHSCTCWYFRHSKGSRYSPVLTSHLPSVVLTPSSKKSSLTTNFSQCGSLRMLFLHWAGGRLECQRDNLDPVDNTTTTVYVQLCSV